jgi:hypothetical protein
VPPSTQNPSGTSYAPARTAVTAFTARGGAILGRTNAGFNAAVAAGLMSGTVTNGNGSGNGIVAVDTPEGSVLAPYAQDSSFIYPAYSFVPGTGTKVEQTYDAVDPLLAGHWRATNATNGPEVAAGKASVVSSENATTGAKSLVFGTSVFFRTHPKGGLSQAARALMWAAPEGEPVVAPVEPVEPTETSVAVGTIAPVTYPADPSVTVTPAAGDGTTPGTVELLLGEDVVASTTTEGGPVTLTVPDLVPGYYAVTARFTPTAETFAPSTSDPVRFTVLRATSSVQAAARSAKAGPKAKRARVTVGAVLTVPGVDAGETTGPVKFSVGGKVIRNATVTAGTPTVVSFLLPKGTRTITVTYAGNELVRGSTVRTTLRVG